jgi:ubiquitin C-terminal hydrolase
MIIDQMQDFFENKLTPITARLWFYLNNKVEIIPYEDSLEKHGITNVTIAIIETKKNGLWQIDALKLNSEEEIVIGDISPLVGLTNVGNSCYMNSVLQIFLNIPEMKDIFLKNSEKAEETEEKNKEIFSQDLLHFIFKDHKNNFLLKNYLNLFKLKYFGDKRCLNPKLFKEICGKYNNTFMEDEQQDAYDFYTFLLDTLHEESNIKFKKEEN